MENTLKDKNPLANEAIGKLMIRFAIPCIISLLVNSLYNIVDQIFIGRGVGYLGNGATNVVFPITVVSIAFALLIGDGGAAFLSLKLGANSKKRAKEGVENSLIMLLFTGLIFLLSGILFLKQVVIFFGATELILPYAMDYGKIIVWGLPFFIMGIGLNSIIRANSSPKYAMFSMIVGAVINVILDPVLIFVFNMGVKGAAIATIIGQIASFTISASYILRFKSINIDITKIRFSPDTAKKVLGLGASSFINNISITIVIAVTNNMLVYYGAQSVYGAEIPLSALGIVMKVNHIMVSMLMGIAIGAQPIIGFNYGAGNFKRVKTAYLMSITASTTIAAIGSAFFIFFPGLIVNVFGAQDPLYNEFARMCFQIFLRLCILTGFQFVSGIFFQAIGHPKEASLISLSRQIIFLTPASIILPRFFGVKGILFAGPVADSLSFILAITLVILKMKDLDMKHKSLERKIIETPV